MPVAIVKLRTLLAVAVLVLLAGCSPSTDQAFLTDQSNGSCPNPTQLTGKNPPGAPCASAHDCAPVCCTCSNNDGSEFYLAYCQNTSATSMQTKACAGASACAGAESASLCP